MSEWLENQPPIYKVEVDSGCPGYSSGRAYVVGARGVTRIEAITKSGQYAYIPYVRVWVGDKPFTEFCQHNIVGIYFAPESSLPKQELTDEIPF
jgi:hypothetical protein